MGLNISKGNMYDFISHTWNVLKGRRLHACIYCFMLALAHRFNNMKGLHLDEAELRVNLGKGNFIFVGSSTDMFAADVPADWIMRVLDYANEFDNRYLWQSKNPARILKFINHPVFQKSVVCTTIETNRWYPDIMNNAPLPEERAKAMAAISAVGVTTYVTCEPFIAFDHDALIALIRACNPAQVNIGKNSVRSVCLPEPTRDEVQAFIADLKTFTNVKVKSNASEWM